MTMNSDDQLNSLIGVLRDMRVTGERFVLSFDKIAQAMAGIHETYKEQVAKQFPQRSAEVREAVVTRVPTQEDRIREQQGASIAPIADWLDLEAGEEDDIGVREREWLAKQRHAGTEEDR